MEKIKVDDKQKLTILWYAYSKNKKNYIESGDVKYKEQMEKLMEQIEKIS